MALTKVSGPLLNSGNHNLGNYVINNITGAAATFSSLDVSGGIVVDTVSDLTVVGILTNNTLTPGTVAWVGTGQSITESDNLTWDNTNVRLKNLGITSTKDLNVTGISTLTGKVLLGNRLGIGSDSPTAPLNVAADTSTGTCVKLIQESTNKEAILYFQDWAAGGNDSWIKNENSNLTVYAGYGGKLHLGAYQTTGITVLTSGNVGVGSTTPGSEFDVFGSGTVANFKGTGGNCFIGLTDVGAGSGVGYIGSHAGALLFQTPGNSYSTKLQITSAGKVGIGSTIPSEKLDVNGTIQCLNKLKSKTGNDLILNAGSANRDVKIQVNDVNMLYVKGDTGNIGIGTDAPQRNVHIHQPTAASSYLHMTNSTTGAATTDGFSLYVATDGQTYYRARESGGTHRFYTGTTEKLHITSVGRVLIGTGAISATSNPVAQGGLQVSTNGASGAPTLMLGADNSAANTQSITDNTGKDCRIGFPNYDIQEEPLALLNAFVGNGDDVNSTGARICYGGGSSWLNSVNNHIFYTHATAQNGTTGTERLRILADGSILHKRSTNDQRYDLEFRQTGGIGDGNYSGVKWTQSSNGGTFLGSICMSYSDTGRPDMIFYQRDRGGSTGSDEGFRLTRDGNLTTCETHTFARANAGFTARKGDSVSITRDTGTPVEVNRTGNDGYLMLFYQAGSNEGGIHVSGASVTLVGGSLSRWSQLVGISTNNKADRPSIYSGTIMSNLDEMCEWTGEENMQLNKTQVSTVSGDKNVAGVFRGWDDDDDNYTNDFFIAQTGDYIIRVGAATTVTRGDLLESAGDGTAKPQSDDIVRSKTIAKVTSGIAHTTYPDGSKTYPCVLMAS